MSPPLRRTSWHFASLSGGTILRFYFCYSALMLKSGLLFFEQYFNICIWHGRGIRQCTTIMASIRIKSNYRSRQVRYPPPPRSNCWFYRGRKWGSPLLEHFLERRKRVGPFAHYWWYTSNLFWYACGLVSPSPPATAFFYQARLFSTSRIQAKETNTIFYNQVQWCRSWFCEAPLLPRLSSVKASCSKMWFRRRGFGMFLITVYCYDRTKRYWCWFCFVQKQVFCDPSGRVGGVSEPLTFVASVFKSLCCVFISDNKFVTEFI
jgi:hypothetical protein